MYEVIKHPDLETSMGYPVGENIKSNMKHISAMISAIEGIEAFKGKYLNLVCRGSSGAIIAAIVSSMIKNENHIVHIKKDGENSHCGAPSIKTDNAVNIIIDDFMCSGLTLKAIYAKLCKSLHNDNLVVDCICISGCYFIDSIDFKTKYIICGRIDN